MNNNILVVAFAQGLSFLLWFISIASICKQARRLQATGQHPGSSAIYSASRDEALPRQDPAVTVPMHGFLTFTCLLMATLQCLQHGKVTATAGWPHFATGWAIFTVSFPAALQMTESCRPSCSQWNNSDLVLWALSLQNYSHTLNLMNHCFNEPQFCQLKKFKSNSLCKYYSKCMWILININVAQV